MRDRITPAETAVLPSMRRRRRRSGLLPSSWAVGLVMAGGAVGTAARYGLGQRFPVAAGTFPTTTLAENVAGAALLGCLMTLMVERGTPNRWFRPLLATGMLGSFTTFSTFAAEIVLLVRDERAAVAAAYVTATVVLGVAAAVAGIGAARAWASPRRRGAGP